MFSKCFLFDFAYLIERYTHALQSFVRWSIIASQNSGIALHKVTN